MKHIIENKEISSQLIIDETLCENTKIEILSGNDYAYHYLTPKELKNLIGALLHVQAKKRKEAAEFDNLSNKF
tara:strand:- start:343 stop:561 length:219 start_codon:yes stop_codon:yes gene_type:complete